MRYDWEDLKWKKAKRKLKFDLQLLDSKGEIRALNLKVNELYEKIRKLNSKFSYLSDLITDHHKCYVCNVIGHEPEMAHVSRFGHPIQEVWVHTECMAVSDYERRKDARRNDGRINTKTKSAKS